MGGQIFHPWGVAISRKVFPKRRSSSTQIHVDLPLELKSTLESFKLFTWCFPGLGNQGHLVNRNNHFSSCYSVFWRGNIHPKVFLIIKLFQK